MTKASDKILTKPSGSEISATRLVMRFCTLIAAVWLAALPRTAHALPPDFLIGPGDVLRIAVMGVPDSEIEAVVELDGSLNLVWLGRVMAADKTIEQLTEEIRERARGTVLKSYARDGALTLIQVTKEDIFLQVSEYRPVVVSGDVAQPGDLPYRPGITARRAIAQAGGARSAFLNDVLVTDPVQIVRWQNEYARAALDHAVSLVRLWRLGAEIDDTPDASPPDALQVAVDNNVLNDLIAEQKRIMDLQRQNEAGDRAFLEESLVKARNRIEILKQQSEKASDLLAADEEEEERIEGLLERGLAPATRLADIRRDTLLSATRLLDLEEALASAELEVTRLQRELDEYEETRLAALFDAREETYSRVLDTRLQMDLFAQNLSGNAGAIGDLGVDLELNVSTAVLRYRDGKEELIELEMEDPLLPGDTLIVTIQQPQGFGAFTE